MLRRVVPFEHISIYVKSDTKSINDEGVLPEPYFIRFLHPQNLTIYHQITMSSLHYTPIILKAASVFFIYAGAEHVVRGINKYLSIEEQEKLPSQTVAFMDSQYRFLGGIFIGFGVAVAWTVSNIPAYWVPLKILLGAMMLGGVGRAVSAAVYGWKPTWTRQATINELIIPPALYWIGIRKYI